MILGILEVPLNYLLDSAPDTLVIIRSFGISIGALAVLLLQFSSKLLYLYEKELSTTFGSSSLSSSSNKSRERSKAMKAAASKGGFTIKPDLLKYGGFALSTISHPEKFYDESNILSSSASKRNTSRMSRNSRSEKNL